MKIVNSFKKKIVFKFRISKINFRLQQIWEKKEIYPKACCDFYLPGTPGVHHTISSHLASL